MLIIEVDKKKVFASDAGLAFDINKETVRKILANKKITDFSPGDSIKVGV